MQHERVLWSKQLCSWAKNKEGIWMTSIRKEGKYEGQLGWNGENGEELSSIPKIFKIWWQKNWLGTLGRPQSLGSSDLNLGSIWTERRKLRRRKSLPWEWQTKGKESQEWTLIRKWGDCSWMAEPEGKQWVKVWVEWMAGGKATKEVKRLLKGHWLGWIQIGYSDTGNAENGHSCDREVARKRLSQS